MLIASEIKAGRVQQLGRVLRTSPSAVLAVTGQFAAVERQVKHEGHSYQGEAYFIKSQEKV